MTRSGAFALKTGADNIAGQALKTLVIVEPDGGTTIDIKAAVTPSVHIFNDDKYIKNPHVSVLVEEHFSQRITLIGQFKTPGTYDYISKMRLLDVMALAGGLNEKAGHTAQIRRRNQSAEPVTILIDLEKIIN